MHRHDTYDERLVLGDRRKPPSGTVLCRRRLSRIACGALILTSQGCAFSYTDAAGDRHAIGLLDIVVRSSAAPQTFAGSVVEITSFGLSVGRTAQGGYVTVGYNREATAALRDNALVLGNPTALLRPFTQDQPGNNQ